MKPDVIFDPLRSRNLTVRNRTFRWNIAGRFRFYDGSGSGSEARTDFDERFAPRGASSRLTYQTMIGGGYSPITRPSAQMIELLLRGRRRVAAVSGESQSSFGASQDSLPPGGSNCQARWALPNNVANPLGGNWAKRRRHFPLMIAPSHP